MHPERIKSKDDDFEKEKKEEKAALNTVEVEELFKLKQVDSKLSLMERKSETTTDADLEACKKLLRQKT